VGLARHQAKRVKAGRHFSRGSAAFRKTARGIARLAAERYAVDAVPAIHPRPRCPLASAPAGISFEEDRDMDTGAGQHSENAVHAGRGCKAGTR
jgi:hypothetical protein